MTLKNVIHLKRRVLGFLVTLTLCFILVGCQTIPKAQNSQESTEDVQEAFAAVAGALSGKKLSEDELRNLKKQIQTDEDAQTAVQAIAESVGAISPTVKFCPVTGRRYAAYLEICPDHQVKLKVVGQ